MSTKSSVTSCRKNAHLFLPLEWSLCCTNTHFVSFVSDLSSGVRPRCRSSTGAFCWTSPGCWWRLCTCRRCCSSPSLQPGSSSGSTPPSAGVRPVFTRVQASSPVLVFILPVWCCRSSVSDCCDVDPAEKTVWWWGVSLLSLYQSIFRYFCGDNTSVCVQVLGRPGEPPVVDNQDSHPALYLCEHTSSLHLDHQI